MNIDAPVVTLASGAVRGRAADGIRTFLGIPYAAPPIAERRWRAPAPAASWSGVRDAGTFGPGCPQPFCRPLASHAPERTDEDCLYLNVWAPEGRQLPVAVIVHGGGFQLGAGSAPAYSGAALAREGIVTVNFNYRLGPFGFRFGPWWLLDQLAAIRWVRENIAAFGGDPARITLLGVSAGGVSVHALNASPAAQHLFSQAIVVSAGGDLMFSADMSAATPEPHALERPWQELVYPRAFPDGAGERPVIDGTSIAGPPSEIFASGSGPIRRLMTASSDFEGSLLDALGIDPGLAALQLSQADRTEDRTQETDAERGRRLFGDVFFRQPCLQLAEAATRGGATTHLLDFRYIPEGLRGRHPGAFHGAAMFAILGTEAAVYADFGATPTSEDLAVSARLRRRAAAFIRGAAPQTDETTPWPALAAGAAPALVVDAAGKEIPW